MAKRTKDSREIEKDPVDWFTPGFAEATMFLRDTSHYTNISFRLVLGNTNQSLATRIGSDLPDYLPIEEFEVGLRQQAPRDRHLIAIIHNYATDKREISVAYIFPGREDQLYDYEIEGLSTLTVFYPVVVHEGDGAAWVEIVEKQMAEKQKPEGSSKRKTISKKK